MKIRTRLLIAFLSLSMLIFIVSMIFYIQLKNLIEPLTPQSIPQSAEKLSRIIDRNDFVSRLANQQLLAENNLDNYVFTQKLTFLQKYYLHEAMLNQLLENTQQSDPLLYNQLSSSFTALDTEWISIANLMREGKIIAAQQKLSSPYYMVIITNVRNAINNLYLKSDIVSNESAAVTVRLAAKNTTRLLHASLNSTMVIFIDAIVISLLLAFYSSRAISQPINLLRNNMERLSKENLNAPYSANLKKLHGEIGDLAESFITLIEKLRATTVLKDELLLEIERRKQSEERLSQTAKQLQESNRELDQFAYAASHDLRAPLRGIESLSQWIIEDCYDLLPTSSKEHLELLKKRVKRLDGLIRGILDYSRISKTAMDMEAIDSNRLVLDVIDSLGSQENIKIVIDNRLPIVVAHQSTLDQIFLNLISNAIKFNDKAPGHIHIGCKTLADHYTFYVMDDGPGIDSAFHKRIFELFQTLQPQDESECSGIGLAIVKKIVEQQGGKIWVVSDLGKGATFYFTWKKL